MDLFKPRSLVLAYSPRFSTLSWIRSTTANLRTAPPPTSCRRCSRSSTACPTLPTRYDPQRVNQSLTDKQHTRRTTRHVKDGCAFQMCGQGFKLSCAVAFFHQRGRHFPVRRCIECPRKTTVQHRDIITQQDDEVFYVNRFNPQKLKKLVFKMFLFTCKRFLL